MQSRGANAKVGLQTDLAHLEKVGLDYSLIN